MQLHNLLSTAFLCLLAATSSAEHTMVNLKQTPESITTMLQLHPDVLQSESYRDIPCRIINICGKEEVMKSTLLRALGVLFEMSDAPFEINDRGFATATRIDISDVSRDNYLLFDTTDPSFDLGYGMDPIAVVFSQLIAPVSNVLIYPLNRKMMRSDLESLEMYADHTKYHVGELHKQGGGKPSLILALRAKALYCITNGKVQECDTSEYLQQVMPADHTARNSFDRIELVHIPELKGDDFKKIQPDSFSPKEVVHYWKAIERIGQIINEGKSDDLSVYWTGGELGRIFELLVPMINGDIDLDIAFVYHSAMIISSQREARKCAETFGVKLYHRGMRDEAEGMVLKKYEMFRRDLKLYGAIEEAVAEVFDQEVNDIEVKVDAPEKSILQYAQSVYESARQQLSSAEMSLPDMLTGDAGQVDYVLLNSLKSVIHHAAVKGWPLPEQVAKDNLDKLTKYAMSIWTTAHDINSAKHINRQHVLRDQALPPVQIFHQIDRSTCCNTHATVREPMAEKYPQFFSDEALNNTISIDAEFHSKVLGSGRLVLHGEDKEYTICKQWNGTKRGHGSSLSFNPVSKELHAETFSWGFRCGNCRQVRLNWMQGVSFTIVANALSVSPKYYALPYENEKGVTPQF